MKNVPTYFPPSAEVATSGLALCSARWNPKTAKLPNKAKSQIHNPLPINKKHKQRAILSHQTKPKIKAN
jgi:hypothetical protein